MRSRLSRLSLQLVLSAAITFVLSLGALSAGSIPAAQAAHDATASIEQETPGALNTETRFLILYPELRQAPAPAWLKPAVRLSYNFAFANFSDDPNGVTPSGASIIQFDVIAQDRRTVVLLPTMYSTTIQGQSPTTLGAVKSLPGGGDLWFAPQVLATAEKKAGDSFSVTHMPMTVEGKRYNVVRMQSTATGGYGQEVWAYDEATGVLVYHSQSLYDAAGNQKSGHVMTLIGRRQLKLPWATGTAPAWVKKGVRIDLAGSQLMDLGGPPYVRLPMQVSTRLTFAAPGWSEHAQNTVFNGQQVSQSTGATGVAQIFGGMWLPLQALTALKTGAVLDRDPITGATTSVESADRQAIAVVQQGPGYLLRYTYDAATGRLVAYYQEAHFQAGIQYTKLEAP